MRTTQLSTLRISLLAALGLAGCGSDTSEQPTTTLGDCAGATPVQTNAGTDSGFVKCDDGTMHRPATATCETTAPACTGTEKVVMCSSDADCTAQANGRCSHYEASDEAGPYDACGCIYPCAADADCSDGQVCVCAGVLGWERSGCITASCKTDADCPSGECGVSRFDDGCGLVTQLACRATTDACRVDADCPDAQACASYSSPEWSCHGSECAIGRPLLVDGVARSAPAVGRADWASALAPDAALPAEVRATLAERWTRIAALEHASIGSFARFSLQLLALGAPSDLLADAQRAALDEVEHARIAYALASTYAGRPLGPGAVDAATAPIPRRLVDFLMGLVEEACVGETVGVAEASYIAATATDETIAQVHARIAEDEVRHAALAWRALRWGLEIADEATRSAVEQSLDRACDAIGADLAGPRVISRGHGLLSGAEHASVRRRAVAEVVRPCANALFDALRARPRGIAASSGAT